jgi:hypothetical protein
MLDQIMEVLTPRRMMTVGNIALSLEKKPAELIPSLQELEADGRVRYAFSKCNGSCSSCSSGCGDEVEGEPAMPAIDETSIIISLEFRNTDD